MYAYRTPGVHVDWLGAEPGIGLRRTDVAGFVGIAERGPLHEPVRVQSWAEFTGVFGGHLSVAYLAYAVAGFFANSGRTCWVVRVADPEAAAFASADVSSARGWAVLRLTATSPGIWAHRMTVSVVPTVENRFTLVLLLPDGTSEQWRDLSLDPSDPRFAVKILDGSTLIRAERLGTDVPRSGVVRLAGGADGLSSLRPEHLSGADNLTGAGWGLGALDTVDEVGVVAVPDIMAGPLRVTRYQPVPGPHCYDLEPTTPPAPPRVELPDRPPVFTDAEIFELQTAVMRHCLLRHDRFAVLDSRFLDRSSLGVLTWRARFEGTSLGEWAGLYYPWLRVPDPLAPSGTLREVPPSGHVAGVFARTDLRDGVHRAPANEIVESAYDVLMAVDDLAHGELNDRSVNVIRPWNARGLRVAGARTLSSSLPMRYVNVRRLLSMIEEAIDEQTQWTVFEPNAIDLWRDIDRIVRGLLDDLWRRGMLNGTTPEVAYFVRCDETTNTPSDLDAGRLVCVIGVQPPVPAEFVMVRIVRDATAITFEETSEVPSG